MNSQGSEIGCSEKPLAPVTIYEVRFQVPQTHIQVVLHLDGVSVINVLQNNVTGVIGANVPWLDAP